MGWVADVVEQRRRQAEHAALKKSVERSALELLEALSPNLWEALVTEMRKATEELNKLHGNDPHFELRCSRPDERSVVVCTIVRPLRELCVRWNQRRHFVSFESDDPPYRGSVAVAISEGSGVEFFESVPLSPERTAEIILRAFFTA